tara:strand:- start:1797 stop:2765 length:969 start_codon:yes stop_codon:yes gene_type:complete
MLKIERYKVSNANQWDKFVLSSNNGTIFHLKQFLNYHPEERFIDHSLVITKREKIFSVFPAAEKNLDGEKTLVSHPGSSVGSFAVPVNLSLANALALVKKLKAYSREQKFRRIIITLPPYPYQNRPSDYMEYAFFSQGFRYKKREVTSILFLDKSIDRILDNFHTSHKRSIRKASEIGIKIRQSDDLETFYKILQNNLKTRHGVKPTHTLDELKKIKAEFPKEVTLFGAYYNDMMVAGVINFHINNKALLAFYISHDENYSDLRSVNLLFYFIFSWAINNGYNTYDFGIFTIDGEPNMGLGRFKENFGASGIFRNTIEIRLQ